MSQQTDYATYATQAVLALTAYADLRKDASHREELRRVGMTDSLVEEFLNTWKFVVQVNFTRTGFLTILEHMSDGRKYLAISWVQPQEPSDPGGGAVSVADISLKPDSLYTAVKSQVKEWIDNGTLPEGSTVAGHFVGGHLAIALKKEFPKNISAAYFFMGDTSGKIYGMGDNGVFATDTHKSIMDSYPRENDEAIAGGVDDKPCTVDISPGRPEQMQTSNNHDLEDNSMKRLAGVLLALELLTGCVLPRITPTQMKMDAEVDRLCAIDGGLKIYETVCLPPEKFNKYNQINFYRPTQGENTLGPEYIWKSDTKYLQPGEEPSANPRMWRDHVQLFRRSDGRLLGEFTRYTRYGGDPRFLSEHFFGGQSSHYSCPEENVGDVPLIDGVFIKNETGRTR